MVGSRIVFLAGLVLGSSATVLAHHGVAPHYDNDNRVTITGVVDRFDFINPHSFVYVEVRDEHGETQMWQCELHSRSVLSRNGVEADLFTEGERVTIEGAAARRNATGCALRTARFEDGTVLSDAIVYEPRVAKEHEPDTPADSIFGAWMLKEFGVSYYEGDLTRAGEQAREAFDPVADDPSMHCEPGSPVRVWVTLESAFEIRQEDDRVIIDHQYMDTTRVVHLDMDEHPENIVPSQLGHSIGRFEGSRLIVETAGFSAGALEPRRGVVHSDQLKLSEELAVNPETGELEITWIIDDPVYFREPVVQTEYYVRAEPDPEPYDCQPVNQ